MSEKITVDKLSPQGELKWRYEGELLERGENWARLEAFFDRDNIVVAGIPLQRGDRFVETYFSDRWYNIFEIHAGEGGALRGWYCNITRPANILSDRLEYVDLFLDLWVSPDGRQTVLDEEEFQAADLEEETRRSARQALAELQETFSASNIDFQVVGRK